MLVNILMIPSLHDMWRIGRIATHVWRRDLVARNSMRLLRRGILTLGLKAGAWEPNMARRSVIDERLSVVGITQNVCSSHI